MSDNADIAARNREVYLAAALQRRIAIDCEPQLIEDGIVLCIDCENPITPERLEAMPTACRCVYCQNQRERK